MKNKHNYLCAHCGSKMIGHEQAYNNGIRYGLELAYKELRRVMQDEASRYIYYFYHDYKNKEDKETTNYFPY